MNSLSIEQYLHDTSRRFTLVVGRRVRFELPGVGTLSLRARPEGGLQRSDVRDTTKAAQDREQWVLTTNAGDHRLVADLDDLDALLPPTTSSLRRELEGELGAKEAGELLRLLRARDRRAGVRSDAPTRWRRELMTAYRRGGDRAPEGEAADQLRLLAQHLRQELGLGLRRYDNHEAWKRLHAAVADLAVEAGEDVRMAQQAARRRISARFGLASTTEVPPTLFKSAVEAALLPLYLSAQGGRPTDALVSRLTSEPGETPGASAPPPPKPTTPLKVRQLPTTYHVGRRRVCLLSEIAACAGVSVSDAEGVAWGMGKIPEPREIEVNGAARLALPAGPAKTLLRQLVKWRRSQPSYKAGLTDRGVRGVSTGVEACGSCEKAWRLRQERDIRSFGRAH